MPISESMVQDIVQEVMAKMQIADAPAGKHGIFTDMNEAIEAAKASQKIVRKMSLDQREKIITCIRRKTKENAEILARMGVDETGMGNVGDKILKHHLVADKTPGTEDLSTTAWSGDRGLTLIEMGPFGVIGAITPCTNPSETILCNTIGMLAGGNTVVFNPVSYTHLDVYKRQIPSRLRGRGVEVSKTLFYGKKLNSNEYITKCYRNLKFIAN